jgi:hypothetical protein
VLSIAEWCVPPAVTVPVGSKSTADEPSVITCRVPRAFRLALWMPSRSLDGSLIQPGHEEAKVARAH